MENAAVEKKKKVLCRMAQDFNDAGITWAVGGSVLLYFEGLVTDFHDLDISVTRGDAATACRILDTLGQPQPSEQNSLYQTECFREYTVEGVEVDLMAGFSIMASDGLHSFPLKKQSICRTVYLGETAIPLQSLEDWELFYDLMGRPEKARMIRTYRTEGNAVR